MIVVSNSSPLIGLAKADRLKLLQQMYRTILVPPQVYEDVVVAGRGRRGARAVMNAVQQGWIRVVPVRNHRLVPRRLSGTGEGEAIVLSLEERADFLIVDDRIARIESTKLHVPWVTTVGVIRDARAHRLVRRVKPIFDRMIARGFGIADYEAILRALGE